MKRFEHMSWCLLLQRSALSGLTDGTHQFACTGNNAWSEIALVMLLS